jgi:Fe-S cluster assembly protein SufD
LTRNKPLTSQNDLLKPKEMNETIQTNKLHLFTENLTETTLPFSAETLQHAQQIIHTSDFPTTRIEAWKYTRVGKIAAIRSNAPNQQITHSSRNQVIEKNALTFVFENGEFISAPAQEELPKGLTIKPLSVCTKEELQTIGCLANDSEDVFQAINTAFTKDGIYVHVADNCELSVPVQLIHTLTGENTVANFRNYISVGNFAKASLIQGYFSEAATNSFVNVVSEIKVGQNANFSIHKMQYESAGNFHVSTEAIAQEKDSTFTIHTFTLNGSLVRNNLHIAVNGTNCTTNLNGIYLLKENQHVDNHTIVDHKAPHCQSNELYKGVMDDASTAVFNGKVFVRQDAQKINAFQSNANVLLSDTASINSKPELEIYADDVKCSHGSTTGQLDEEAIFYLRARGISEISARQLMVSAFIADVLDKVENQAFLDFTYGILNERFGWEF